MTRHASTTQPRLTVPRRRPPGRPRRGRSRRPTLAAVAVLAAVTALLTAAPAGPAQAAGRHRGGSYEPQLHLGLRGRWVVLVQRKVHVPATGYYDLRTKRAVMRFQRQHHLVGDGVVGARTWRAMGGGRHAPRRHRSHRRPHLTYGQRALRVAASERGKPYRWGAAGPRAFDCSGLVMYAFARIGVWLPHNTNAQWAVVHHVSRRSLRVGDIIFIPGPHGSIPHEGLYAGHGRWWVAPHTGAHVQLQRIRYHHLLVGRVGH